MLINLVIKLSAIFYIWLLILGVWFLPIFVCYLCVYYNYFQVAVIASNFELAEIIQNYKSDDIGELKKSLKTFTV